MIVEWGNDCSVTVVCMVPSVTITYVLYESNALYSGHELHRTLVKLQLDHWNLHSNNSQLGPIQSCTKFICFTTTLCAEIFRNEERFIELD